MTRPVIFWTGGVILALFSVFIFYLLVVVKIGPVDLSKNNSIQVIGVIEEVFEAGTKDLSFYLKDDSKIYYINRGLENKFDLESVKNDLEGKTITIWHAKSRSSKNAHIIQLSYKDSIYYTEWDIPLVSKN